MLLNNTVSQGQLHLPPVCRNTLRARRPVPGPQRLAPLTRCQSSRGAPSSFRKEPQEQESTNFRDSAQEKAQAVSKEASKRVKATFKSVSAGVKKRAGQVNERFDLSGRAQQTADRLKEQLEDVDEKLQLRRKARNTLLDVRRQLPQWRRQYGTFSKTLPGQIFQFALVVWFFRSGLFFKLLNFVFVLFWIVPLILVPLARKYGRQAAARQQQAQQQTQQQAQNPFNRFAGFQRPPQQSAANKPQTYGQAYGQQDGPIIDAEWTTIDEGDN
ncbi:hypothetical protein ABBQ38_003328 [Trebouxia sp. C0009 RCD-2024]